MQVRGVGFSKRAAKVAAFEGLFAALSRVREAAVSADVAVSPVDLHARWASGDTCPRGLLRCLVTWQHPQGARGVVDGVLDSDAQVS